MAKARVVKQYVDADTGVVVTVYADQAAPKAKSAVVRGSRYDGNGNYTCGKRLG